MEGINYKYQYLSNSQPACTLKYLVPYLYLKVCAYIESGTKKLHLTNHYAL